MGEQAFIKSSAEARSHAARTSKAKALLPPCASRINYYLCMCKHSHLLPSPVSSHLCAKQVFPKDTLVPKHSAAMGGAPTCRRGVHAQQKVGVARATFITTITHGALKPVQECRAIYCTHTNTSTHTQREREREISTVLLPLCGRYFLSLAYRQP